MTVVLTSVCESRSAVEQCPFDYIIVPTSFLVKLCISTEEKGWAEFTFVSSVREAEIDRLAGTVRKIQSTAKAV